MTTTNVFYATRIFLVSFLLSISVGCASIDPQQHDPADPLEGFNRTMYRFNDALDRAIIKPLAKGYQAIVPQPVDKGVTNFFGNLADVGSAINNVLQLKLDRAANDVGRVLVNSTIGLLGVMDVASNMNMPKHDEDFGQTLGAWGASPGPYIVWPVLGPSSGRDTIGLIVDWFTDPVNYVDDETVRWSLHGLRLIDKRADLLSADKVLEEAALDPYSYVKDAYLQKRNSQVHDGNPPSEYEVD